MYELTVATRFAAAHQIPGHPAECRRLHGHTWKVEVSVAGQLDPATGMVVDFWNLKAAVYEAVGELDHRLLNELPPFMGPDPLRIPTAENIARHIFATVAVRLAAVNPRLKMRAVRVWESPTASVIYSGEG
ncbi:MAG: 6-carboxytetrahydropterin synthase QueD [Thermoanaerobacterales bacterium]|nr:6-carboxytetrahydropterin synthase QueD [Thermoanaerobacterales bacterium]